MSRYETSRTVEVALIVEREAEDDDMPQVVDSVNLDEPDEWMSRRACSDVECVGYYVDDDPAFLCDAYNDVEVPAGKRVPRILVVGRVVFEEVNSIDFGIDHDSYFETTVARALEEDDPWLWAWDAARSWAAALSNDGGYLGDVRP